MSTLALARLACLGALAVATIAVAPSADAAAQPMTSGTGYNPVATAQLRYCSGGMHLASDNGSHSVYSEVSATDPAGIDVACTATLYRNLGGWGQLGATVTVGNGGSGHGATYSDNGTQAYVCVAERDVNSTSLRPVFTGSGCSAKW